MEGLHGPRSRLALARCKETMPRLGSLTARKLLRLAPEPPPPEHIEEAKRGVCDNEGDKAMK